MGDLTTFGWIWRFAVAIVGDLLDFFIGRIPGFGIVFDLGLTAVGLLLWGPVGLIQGVELFDLSEQIDGFLPALTIGGIIKLIKEKGG